MQACGEVRFLTNPSCRGKGRGLCDADELERDVSRHDAVVRPAVLLGLWRGRGLWRSIDWYVPQCTEPSRRGVRANVSGAPTGICPDLKWQPAAVRVRALHEARRALLRQRLKLHSMSSATARMATALSFTSQPRGRSQLWKQCVCLSRLRLAYVGERGSNFRLPARQRPHMLTGWGAKKPGGGVRGRHGGDRNDAACPPPLCRPETARR